MGLESAVRAACTDKAGAYEVDADGTIPETHRADGDGGPKLPDYEQTA